MRTQTWSAWSCTTEVTTLRDTDLDEAVTVVKGVMAEMDAAASRFRDDSDLARINASAGRFVLVSALTLELVDLSLAVAARTGGAVTPTIGAALVSAGYDADIDIVRCRPPLTAGTTDTRPVPDAATSISLDRAFKRVGVTTDTRLDLGAIAKAYAVDEATARCAAGGIEGVLVSIGGDLAVHGAPSEAWRIAVSETAGGPTEMVAIESGALATSSTVGRRWAEGQHHIIDPRTGHAASGRWRTATIWAPTAVEANLLSTWALVDAEGVSAALAAEPRPARMVTSGGDVVTWHGWPTEALETAS